MEVTQVKKKHIFSNALSFAILIAIFAVTWARADGPRQAGLVVAHDGHLVKRCVEFSEDSISGIDLLQRSGLDLNYAPSGMGIAVCRIDNQGCSYPEQDCFCQCQGAPCIYWSYWRLVNDSWEYSNTGASSSQVRHGDVSGWAWGAGSTSQASPPPLVSFEEICGTSPTNTPTPTSTTPPTETPLPTTTPLPTSTPKPPTISRFTADRTTISLGESVMLSWDLAGAKAAYLRYNGGAEGVVAPGNKIVSPEITTVYTLVARNDDGETWAQVTITVNPVPPTSMPTSTATPSATLPPPIPALAVQNATNPMATANPTSVVAATSPTQLANTPIPTETQTPRPSPTGTTLPAIPNQVALAASTSAPRVEQQATPSMLQPDRSAKKRDGHAVLFGVIGVVLLGSASLLAIVGGLITWQSRR